MKKLNMKNLICLFLIFFSGSLVPVSAQDKHREREQNVIDIHSFDSSVSPKNDFYQYINGKWIENTLIPEDRSSWGSFDEIGIRTNENILAALKKAKKENVYPVGTDQYKALAFYELGMDSAYANQLGYEPLKPLLNQISAINNREKLQAYLQEAAFNGVRGFFDFEVYPDFKNTSENVLYLVPGTQGLPNKEYYTKEDDEAVALREKYLAHINKMFQLTGNSPEEAKTKAEKVLALEMQLAGAMLNEVEKRNPMLLYNKRSLRQLSEMVPSLNWADYLRNIGVEGIDSVVVFEPKYMEAVDRVLSEHHASSWRAYLEWNAIHHAANYLSREFEESNHAFYGKVLWGAAAMKPRWESVLEVSNNKLAEAIGKVYVDEFFPPEAKERALEMVDHIIAAFQERIKNLDWMSEETKKEALNKLSTINIKIGYPDQWKDYSKMAIKNRQQGGSYFGNVMAASSWKFKGKMNKIGKSVDREEWQMAPQTVNAYYSPVFNEIAFTAGMLQPPFYNVQADHAVNYGAIGAVIGHEISHGFDDIGSQFDASGNMKDWWTAEDREAFEAKKQLLIEQFNSYEALPGVNVNGALTLGENIGDLGGISVAFDGLSRHLAEKGSPGTIDGFTPEQRFFISYVTIWRTKQREEALRTSLNNDPHSPGRYRAMGPLENLASFHKAFQIEEGDAMYKPESQRVKIW